MPLALDTLAFPDDVYATYRDSAQVRTLTLELQETIDDLPVIVPIYDGVVTADAGTSPRYAATVEVAEANIPDGWLDLLPFTAVAKIRDSIVTSYAGVGASVVVFSGYVDQVQVDRPEGKVTLTLTGWEGRIREDVATTTSKPASTTTVVNQIRAIITRTFDVPAYVDIDNGAGLDTTQTLEAGYTVSPGDDYLQHALDLAKSIGAEVFARPSSDADELVKFIIRPVPGTGDIDNPWNLATPETVLTSSVEAVRRAVNRVRLRFEPASPTTAKPARTGAAEITSGPQDPDNMGRVTEWQRRTGYRAATPANNAAAAVLRQRSRKTRSVSWSQLPAPWCAPGDTVPVRTVTLAVDPDATTRDLIINRLEYPLGAVAPMTVVSRGDYA